MKISNIVEQVDVNDNTDDTIGTQFCNLVRKQHKIFDFSYFFEIKIKKNNL